MQQSPKTRKNMGKLLRGRQLACESLERREVLAGDVLASISGGSALLKGDGASNEIIIARSGPNSFTITGIGTTINGSTGPVTLAGYSKNLTIDMNGGDDIVHLKGTDDVFRIFGDLKLGTQDGNDEVFFQDVSVWGKTNINTGAGDDWVGAADGQVATGFRLAKAASILTGAGNDRVLLDHAQFLDTATLDLGTENDHLSLSDSQFSKAASIVGAAGSDELQAARTGLGKKQSVKTFEARGVTPLTPTPPSEANPTTPQPPTEEPQNPQPPVEQPQDPQPPTEEPQNPQPPTEPSGESGNSNPSETNSHTAANVISQDLTLFVATSGSDASGDGSSATPWVSIQQALNYLAGKTIAANAKVLISVRNGSYTLRSALEIKHAQGSNIHIVGNPSAEGSVVLNFNNNTDGVFVTDGHALGYLDGFTIRGLWNGSGSAGLATSGVRASRNGSISLGDHVTVEKFYYGVQADIRGSVEADSIVVNSAGDGGLFAYNGGVIEATRATIKNAIDTTRQLGGGVIAEIGSTIRCNFLSVTGCLRAGIQAIGGNIRADSFIANGNKGYGVYIDRNGVVDSDGVCSASNNGDNGIHLESGGTLRTYGPLTASNNGGSGLFARAGHATIAGGSHFDGNQDRGIYAVMASSVLVGAGSTISRNKTNGVDSYAKSFIDVRGCTITSNVAKGIAAAFGSFVDATGAAVSSNGGNFAIALDVLSKDGSLIQTT